MVSASAGSCDRGNRPAKTRRTGCRPSPARAGHRHQFLPQGRDDAASRLVLFGPGNQKQISGSYHGAQSGRNFSIGNQPARPSRLLSPGGLVKNIGDYYRAADIFLHPTYHDAGSLSTLKALAAGCSVTSRFDGSADLINNGINGLILDKPDDARELAGILRRLLDAGLRNKLGAAARQLAPSFDQSFNLNGWRRSTPAFYPAKYLRHETASRIYPGCQPPILAVANGRLRESFPAPRLEFADAPF